VSLYAVVCKGNLEEPVPPNEDGLVGPGILWGIVNLENLRRRCTYDSAIARNAKVALTKPTALRTCHFPAGHPHERRSSSR